MERPPDDIVHERMCMGTGMAMGKGMNIGTGVGTGMFIRMRAPHLFRAPIFWWFRFL